MGEQAAQAVEATLPGPYLVVLEVSSCVVPLFQFCCLTTELEGSTVVVVEHASDQTENKAPTLRIKSLTLLFYADVNASSRGMLELSKQEVPGETDLFI